MFELRDSSTQQTALAITPAAEPLLRECLEIRRAALPEDDRLIAKTQSLLGGCLTTLGKYAEAESLLLESNAVLRSVQAGNDDLAREVCQKLVDLYEAWDKPERAADWHARLETTTREFHPAEP